MVQDMLNKNKTEKRTIENSIIILATILCMVLLAKVYIQINYIENQQIIQNETGMNVTEQYASGTMSFSGSTSELTKQQLMTIWDLMGNNRRGNRISRGKYKKLLKETASDNVAYIKTYTVKGMESAEFICKDKEIYYRSLLTEKDSYWNVIAGKAKRTLMRLCM